MNLHYSSMEDSRLELYGCWASSYVYKIIWALKLKGVKFEYIEEDLSNKSSALLKYNPVHEKVPVLVHGGKAVAESAIILEYVEETWPNRTPLLPEDPYTRAMARFWIDFGYQKGLTFYAFFVSPEEDKEKAATKVHEALKVVEDEALGNKKFFGGDSLSLVDLSYGWLTLWFEIMQELVGVQVVGPTTLPRLYRWTINFREEPMIKDNLPDRMALLGHLARFREARLSSSKSN